MKKMLSMLFAVILLVCLGVTVQAADMHVAANISRIDAGEDVIITVTLEEEIPVEEGATMLQGELKYDGKVLEFQEILEKSTQLSNAAKHKTQDKVLFHYLSLDNTAVGFQKGTLITVKFKVLTDLETSHISTDMQFTVYVQNARGQNVGNVTYTPDIQLLVCKEHAWDTGEETTAPACDKTGVKTYTCTFDGCGATRTEEIPATGEHTYENGSCSACGKAEPGNEPTRLPGDVTGDGKVTATDYSRLLAHVKKVSILTDEAALQAADVTGDGKITATDYSRLLAHVKKVAPLW